MDSNLRQALASAISMQIQADCGWDVALNGYRWRGCNAFETMSLLSPHVACLAHALDRLVDGEDWDDALSGQTQEATRAVFAWGGVLRGLGHNPPSLQCVRAVMRTARAYTRICDAPLDSAWTKLAALATGHNADADRPPQVIFDSRVSTALARRIDLAVISSPDLGVARNQIQQEGLGLIPGRGGTRLGAATLLSQTGWRIRWGQWRAQFAASRLVWAVVGALNEPGAGFPQMPIEGGVAAWTTRGVEMVLFMDGY